VKRVSKKIEFTRPDQEATKEKQKEGDTPDESISTVRKIKKAEKQKRRREEVFFANMRISH